MKAFMVTEQFENRAMVVFADHAITARRIGSNEYCEGELRGISVKRARHLDQYEGKGVPASVLISDGWWFECTGCHATINSDFLDDNELPWDAVIGTENSAVFCCAECQKQYLDRQERERAVGQAFLAMMRDLITSGVGNVQFVTGAFREHIFAQETDGIVVVRQASVSFEFPGQTIAPASLLYDPAYTYGPAKLELRCCSGDKKAFEAWWAMASEATP